VLSDFEEDALSGTQTSEHWSLMIAYVRRVFRAADTEYFKIR